MNGNGTTLTGPLFIRSALNQDNGAALDVQVIDADGTISGVIPDAPTGDVTIATSKTLTVTDADALTVGGLIVPQTFFVSISQAGYAFAKPLAVACKVVSVRERHTTAESTAGSLTAMLKKVPSGTAPASGTDCLAAGVNMKGTANTNASPSLHATAANYTLAAGDALGIILSASATELAGSEFMVELKRV